MNRINQLFQTRPNRLLSLYFCAGSPTLDGTVNVIETLTRRGVNMIEIGIPFSDPMADGPVIQSAATQSLRNGMTLKLLFNQLKGIREKIIRPVPLILMGYMNPIIQYGFEHFCQSCTEVGIDGVIIPDLPFDDYMKDFKPIADKYDLRIIMLITPETSDERIRFIDDNTDGFIYMVSSAATTGTQQSFDEMKQQYFNHVRSLNLKNPTMIGFGISNKQTFETAQANANGAIIGSKFVQLLDEEKGDPEKALDRLFISLLK
ncbi:MAG: tryptophan synthase subunit alpha [Paludibacteraceae bacterium]|nr:tryptophan synthase subunit alpha [Paludibacteraceae bacterium]MEE3485088.1 tryptophan synthase subunit alpha [Bacteroidales bacterium]